MHIVNHGRPTEWKKKERKLFFFSTDIYRKEKKEEPLIKRWEEERRGDFAGEGKRAVDSPGQDEKEKKIKLISCFLMLAFFSGSQGECKNVAGTKRSHSKRERERGGRGENVGRGEGGIAKISRVSIFFFFFF